jgi:hypothetical protein
MRLKGKPMKDFTNEELVQKARDNHIWINAFCTINPTEKFLADLGREVLQKLDETDMLDDFGLSKKAIFTINKS